MSKFELVRIYSYLVSLEAIVDESRAAFYAHATDFIHTADDLSGECAPLFTTRPTKTVFTGLVYGRIRLIRTATATVGAVTAGTFTSTATAAGGCHMEPGIIRLVASRLLGTCHFLFFF